jgi:hypothetical protein
MQCPNSTIPFLHYVVSCPGLTPFLFHAEFHNVFAKIDCSVITSHVGEKLFEEGVVIDAVILDDFFWQQAGLRLWTELIQVP